MKSAPSAPVVTTRAAPRLRPIGSRISSAPSAESADLVWRSSSSGKRPSASSACKRSSSPPSAKPHLRGRSVGDSPARSCERHRQGIAAAWTTRALIEAWVENDTQAFTDAWHRAEPHIAQVTRTLIVVTGGLVQTIANAAQLAYEDVLASIWAQLAQRESDDDASRLVRSAVTAWCSGEAADADDLNATGAFDEVDPQLLVMNLLGVVHMLVTRFTEQLGEPTAAG